MKNLLQIFILVFVFQIGFTTNMSAVTSMLLKPTDVKEQVDNGFTLKERIQNFKEKRRSKHKNFIKEKNKLTKNEKRIRRLAFISLISSLTALILLVGLLGGSIAGVAFLLISATLAIAAFVLSLVVFWKISKTGKGKQFRVIAWLGLSISAMYFAIVAVITGFILVILALFG